MVAGVACAFAWCASLVSGDTSWVDRLWSILLETYGRIYAMRAHLADARVNVMAILTTLWGATPHNFARKGGYSGVEDYRPSVPRATMSPWQFQFFNLFVVVLYQIVLLVPIALLALSAYQHRAHGLDVLDVP